MTRREAALNAFYGVLGGIVVDWARLKFTVVPKLEREARIADARNGHGWVMTASGEVAFGRTPYSDTPDKPTPLMTYDLICELDGKPCPCAVADEAKGYVLVYSDPDDGLSPLVRKTGRVLLRTPLEKT